MIDNNRPSRSPIAANWYELYAIDEPMENIIDIIYSRKYVIYMRRYKNRLDK